MDSDYVFEPRDENRYGVFSAKAIMPNGDIEDVTVEIDISGFGDEIIVKCGDVRIDSVDTLDDADDYYEDDFEIHIGDMRVIKTSMKKENECL